MPEPESTVPEWDALAALERFVVENDDLLELEERIGRFNIFDALSISRTEIRHSNFLAWLLDPGESHGQGSLFLRAVVMDLLRQSPVTRRPLSPVELDGVELRGVRVRREWRNIDIVIECDQPRFIVIIENKVDSTEHGNQLLQYRNTAAESFPGADPLFVFLTTDGSAASQDYWTPYTYADIYRVLDRCRRTGSGIGNDVRVFLDHYLALIGSRFMSDSTLDELCRRIYLNHWRALELIFERASPAASILTDIEALLRQQTDRWLVFNKTPKEVQFVPKEWIDLLPPIGTRRNVDSCLWLRLGF